MSLNGKMVLITGAAKRIGRSLSLAVAQAGADVVIHYGNSRTDAENTQMEIESLGQKAFLLQADLTNADQVNSAGEEFIGDHQELFLVEEQPGEEAPYERLLRDAMKGNGALFTREDAVEERSIPYKRGSWGPKEADALIATDGGWHNRVSVQPNIKQREMKSA